MTQPQALYLADVLEDAGKPADITEAAAAELRRLYNLLMDQQGEIYALKMARSMEQKTAALKQAALLEALKLALSSHGVMLMSDPPQEAWKAHRVEAKARAAIATVEGEKT